ncbi:coatomer subunit epsilon-like [Bolinopsis microptera]|uniref:coatomer subunit epsilon-like n=1 Tax=Bolinopsis microptera TaxID=2820187 RepID=UPI003079FFA7
MSDPLFMVKTSFYIGNYRQCVKEAQKLQVGDQPLDLECDILMYRAYLAEGKYNLVLGEVETRSGPEFLALVLLAKIMQNPSNKDAVISEVGNVLNEGAASLCPNVVALLCANVYLLAGDFESTLRVTNSASSLECHALAVQTLLQMNRVDIATKEVKKMQEIDEDTTVSQLSLAALNIAMADTKSIQTAYYVYQELADKFGPTPILLNGQAVCFLLQGKSEQAEDVLQKALDKDSGHPETLINLSIVSQFLGAKDSAKRYISQVKDSHPDHPYVLRLQEKEKLFDEFSSALLSNR